LRFVEARDKLIVLMQPTKKQRNPVFFTLIEGS